ncbi:MAG: FtsQ-type POTRA domain-containing protein [Bacteroidota bacterium]|nr:FtsQ-type POTRA domain-containing protein [Bacteroidota bacterium]
MDNNQLIGEKDEQQPTHGRRVYVYFILLSVLIIAVFGVKAKWQKHVSVRQISVEGVSVVSKEEVVRLINLPPNVPMYQLDLTTIQKNLLANSFIENVIVQRDAPSTLRIIIQERKPSAILVANELYYIAGDGTVLPYIASSETYDIPVISGVDSLNKIKTGQKLINADVQEALEIITASRMTSENLFHAISEIRLRKGHDLILYSFETGAPIIFGKGDAVKKMVKLEAFWQKFLQNNDTKDIQYIDIRFDDQVVVSRKS